MKKWLLIAASVILIGAAGVGGYKWMSKSSGKAPAAAERTTKVTKGELAVNVSGSGTAEPVDREKLLSSDSGKITEVLVKEGDTVKKGQVLIKFEGQDNSTAISQEELNLQQTQLNLADAQNSFKTQVTSDNLDSLKTNIQKLNLQIQQSRDKIQNLKDEEVPPPPITAPIDGTITTLDAEVGQQVNGATKLVEMTNYKDLQVVIQVDELDINQVAIGQKAEVAFDAVQGATIGGTVSAIADEGSATNGVSTYDVTIHLDQSPKVKAGMTANANIIIEDKKDVLLLPIEAVHQFGKRDVVFLPQANAQNGSSGSAGQQGANGQSSGQQRNGQGNGQQRNGQSNGQGNGQQRNGQQQAAGGQGSGAAGNQQASRGNIKVVQVGSHNANFIEITAGLQEGEEVLLPPLVGTTSQQNARFGGPGGFGGIGGGFGGGGNFNRNRGGAQ